LESPESTRPEPETADVDAPARAGPRILPRPEHPISRRLIDHDAVRILYRLHHAGFVAHLVGGSVRDLLLGLHPKDFDIGTNAHPRQIKRLFRRCFLIGRRFRLAHVHTNGKIFEVSTFRAKIDAPAEDDADLMIRRDNTFGTPEEDARRRDFTINGLFYDIATFGVIDWVGGLQDLHAKTIRMIGDPRVRIPEDPVRILRAAKFAAKLGFTIEEELARAMRDFAQDLLKCAKARILVELNKILLCGASAEAFRILRETGALEVLLPEIHAAIEADPDEAGHWLARLEALDGMPEVRERLDVATAMAVLIAPLARGTAPPNVPPAHGGWRHLDAEPKQTELVRGVARRIEIPKAATARLIQVLQGQRRIHQEKNRRLPPRMFAAKAYFEDTLLFTEIDAAAGLVAAERLEFWRSVHEELSFSRRRRREGNVTSPPPGAEDTAAGGSERSPRRERSPGGTGRRGRGRRAGPGRERRGRSGPDRTRGPTPRGRRPRPDDPTGPIEGAPPDSVDRSALASDPPGPDRTAAPPADTQPRERVDDWSELRRRHTRPEHLDGE